MGNTRTWNIISLHQVAFGAAPDNKLDGLKELHGNVFGLGALSQTSVPSENVEELSWNVGALGDLLGVEFDDLRAINPDGPNKVYKRQGVHHLAFYVDDLTACRTDLQSRGFEVTEKKIGAKGHEVFFLLPAKGGLGTLYEFVQAPSSILNLISSLSDLCSLAGRNAKVSSHLESLSNFLDSVRKRQSEISLDKQINDVNDVRFDIIRLSDISPVVILFYFAVIPVLAVLWLSIFLANVPVTGLVVGVLLGAGALLTLRHILSAK